MKKAKYSKRDSRGILFVDCSECQRGGMSKGTDLCSSGWQIQQGGIGGCFAGALLPHLEERS